MRDLAKTEVVKSAAIGTLAVGLACYPRLALWPSRGYPVWYLEAVLLLGGFVLWAFVFAWHAKYAGQPVLTLRLPSKPCIVATVAGIFMALTLNEFVDPLFRASTPEDYPANLPQWIATTLFSLGFAQLFLVFAPFDWSIRLTQRRWFAMLFTILFGIFVLVVKTHSSAVPVEPALFWLLLPIAAFVL